MRPAPLVLSTVALAACGARTDLDVRAVLAGEDAATASGSGASSGSTSSSATSSGSGGGGGGGGCGTLVLRDPVVVVPSPSGVARAPELFVLPGRGDAFVALLAADHDQQGALECLRTDAFAAWPPSFEPAGPILPSIGDFLAGTGPEGPVALVDLGIGEFVFVSRLLPEVQLESFGVSLGTALFAAAIPDRHLAASAHPTTGYAVSDVSSHQPGSLWQSEPPLLCLTTAVLGAAIPVGTGFVAAFSGPDPPEPSCDVQDPKQGTAIAFVRYESPAAPGSFLELSIGDRLVSRDPVDHLLLAPASSGAWAVFQRAGADARVRPPVHALRIDGAGHALSPGEPPVAVSPAGASGPLAVAAIGDALAVAWIDNVDPSSPTIIVQVVEADGSIGAAASVPTSALWQTGRVRMLAAPDQGSLLVAWEGGLDQVGVGLARLDCGGAG